MDRTFLVNRGRIRKVALEVITPNRARELISAGNGHKRNLKWDAVGRYAKDMMNGNWAVNGATMVIGPDGELLDGNHRAVACIRGDTPFETLVVYLNGRDDVATIDTGRPRTFQDTLGIVGQKASNEETAFLVSVCRWVHAGYHKASLFPRLGMGARISLSAATRTSIRAILSHTCDVVNFNARAKVGDLCERQTGWLWTTWHFRNFMTKQQRALCEEYFEQIKTGVGLREDSCVYHARETIFKVSGARLGSGNIEAYRAFVLGLRSLIFSPKKSWTKYGWGTLLNKHRIKDPRLEDFVAIFPSQDAEDFYRYLQEELGPLVDNLSSLQTLGRTGEDLPLFQNRK